MYNFYKILLIFFLTVTHLAIGLKFKYKISSADTSIGNLIVAKTENSDLLQIEVVSEVKVKLFITII